MFAGNAFGCVAIEGNEVVWSVCVAVRARACMQSETTGLVLTLLKLVCLMPPTPPLHLLTIGRLHGHMHGCHHACTPECSFK